VELSSGERGQDVVAALAEVRANGGLLWVDLDHPDATAFADLGVSLGLHPLAVEDAVRGLDRPKLDRYDEQQFVSLHTLRHDEEVGPWRVGRVMLFLGNAFVVTVRREDGDTIERARRRLGATTASCGTFDVLHAVVDVVVDDLMAASRALENALLASADRLFGAGRSDEAQVLYELTRQLLALAHAVEPLIEPLRHLSAGAVADMDIEVRRRFQDVLDHALLVDREVRDHTELMEHLRGSNDSRIGLQQNTDMRKIAAWAAIIAVPTAVTGFYGMNVPYPGYGRGIGVVVAVVIQLGLVAGLIGLFRRRGWL
jgi:magnesium transporter